jgi:hypothetical protein
MTMNSDLPRIALLCVTTLLGTACTDGLLDVTNPDVIDPANLGTAQGAAALYAGAVSDFAVAHDGGGNPEGAAGVLLLAGLFTDQYRFPSTPPEVRQLDLTDVVKENSFFQVTYRALHRARTAADRAVVALTNTGDGSDSRVGEMHALSAAAYIVVGEHFCSGTPFSSVGTDGVITYGVPLSTSETMDAALARLQAADGAAAGDPRVQNLAAVLRGRALLNQGQFAQAAQAVAGVPTNYVYELEHEASNSRTQNSMKSFQFDFEFMSVSDGEGGAGLNFATASDPRVVVEYAGVSNGDGETPMFRFLQYDSWGASVTLASGVEARLIEAEAALQAGDVPGWLAGLDAARGPFGMGAVADPGNTTARQDLMMRERAFAMFSTGHRLGDMRRMVRQYDRSRNDVFPSGAYHKDNLTRGTQMSFIIPSSEENNPNFNSSSCNPDGA